MTISLVMGEYLAYRRLADGNEIVCYRIGEPLRNASSGQKPPEDLPVIDGKPGELQVMGPFESLRQGISGGQLLDLGGNLGVTLGGEASSASSY